MLLKKICIIFNANQSSALSVSAVLHSGLYSSSVTPQNRHYIKEVGVQLGVDGESKLFLLGNLAWKRVSYCSQRQRNFCCVLVDDMQVDLLALCRK